VTLASDFLALLPEFDEFASSATYIATPGTVTDAGVLTETLTSTAVQLFGPIGELKTSEAAGSTCTFYIGADQGVVPRVGHRLAHNLRPWLITSVERLSVNGTSIMWALGCGECGAAIPDTSVPPAEVADG
jgi:hypothetical protein